MSEHEASLLAQICNGEVPEHVVAHYNACKLALDRISGGDFAPQILVMIVQTAPLPSSVSVNPSAKPKVKEAAPAPKKAEAADPFGE